MLKKLSFYFMYILARLGIISRTDVKEKSELDYWKTRKNIEGELSNEHYRYFFTEHFSLDEGFYSGKKVLDIGCGPRGSLEWADMTGERVGLDPLADKYLQLNAGRLKMKLVKGYSENIPFPDAYFDIVTSFNSIDHVEELDETCREIERVLKKGGLFLLLTDVHDRPTINEPQTITWDLPDKYFTNLENLEVQKLEKQGKGIYQSIREGIPFDFTDTSNRYGILSVKYRKK